MIQKKMETVSLTLNEKDKNNYILNVMNRQKIEIYEGDISISWYWSKQR